MKVPAFERVADVARRNGRERPDKILFHFEGRATTYAAFDASNNRAANALIASGLKPDDRVAYLGKNSDLYFELVMAVAKAGGVMTPVNWRLAVPRSRGSSTIAVRVSCSWGPNSPSWSPQTAMPFRASSM